jgi:hypothetical protein
MYSVVVLNISSRLLSRHFLLCVHSFWLYQFDVVEWGFYDCLQADQSISGTGMPALEAGGIIISSLHPLHDPPSSCHASIIKPFSLFAFVWAFPLREFSR